MLYRWPQGRIIRTLSLVLTVVIAAHLGYASGYQQFVTYGTNDSVKTLIIAIFASVLALVILGAGIALVGFMPKSSQFLIDVEKEMAKVTWPGRSEIIRSSIAIAIVTVVLSLLIFVVDLALLEVLFKQLFGGGA